MNDIALSAGTRIDAAALYLQDICHGASKGAGWWSGQIDGATVDLCSVARERTLLGTALVAQKLCLIHSEVSEAMEGARKDQMDDKLPHRKMLEVELADALIRIFDLSGALGLDLAGAIVEKLAFNANRPDHKLETRQAQGGKAF